MRSLWLALSFVLFALSPVRAEVDDLKATAKPEAQTVLTQEQFDALVKSVTDAVTKSLQAQSLTAQSAAKTVTPLHEDGERDSIVRALVNLFVRTPSVLAAFPSMDDALARLSDRLDRSARGGFGFPAFALILLTTLAGLYVIERLLQWLSRGTGQRLAEKVPEPGGLKSLFNLMLLDALRLVIVAGLMHLVMAGWFANAGAQSLVMGLALDSWLRWRIFAVLAEVVLRPSMPSARIAPVADQSAQKIVFWIVVTSAVGSLARFYTGLFSTPTVLAAALMFNAIILAVSSLAFLYALRAPLTEWLSNIITAGTRGSNLKFLLARHWLTIGIPFVLLITITRMLGALTAEIALPAASAATITVITGYIMLETLLVYIARRTVAPNSLAGQLRPFILRAIHVATLITSVLYLVNIWAVTGLGLVDASRWSEIVDSWRSIGLILLAGFFAWEAVRFISSRYSPATNTNAMMNEDSLSDAHATTTRLQTLMPPFRVAAGVAIAITTALMVLSSLGINTTPLIAGASVLGLAISFGSQALVKDIVSGIFFLADDAFRVGEYIDCKSVKGTVEGFTLRSIKLRHQNGQIHTLPFGQLGQITNFSRDWATVKFNLRFERNTDIEVLRKATKKIGTALMEDPALKDQFIAPLKLQGVADIDENALIMRFKFTVKPINPGLIQRMAIKRMIADFPTLGLKFASSPNLVLQTPLATDPTPIAIAQERDSAMPAANDGAIAISKSP